jgi:hypothetical protein
VRQKVPPGGPRLVHFANAIILNGQAFFPAGLTLLALPIIPRHGMTVAHFQVTFGAGWASARDP